MGAVMRKLFKLLVFLLIVAAGAGYWALTRHVPQQQLEMALAQLNAMEGVEASSGDLTPGLTGLDGEVANIVVKEPYATHKVGTFKYALDPIYLLQSLPALLQGGQITKYKSLSFENISTTNTSGQSPDTSVGAIQLFNPDFAKIVEDIESGEVHIDNLKTSKIVETLEFSGFEGRDIVWANPMGNTKLERVRFDQDAVEKRADLTIENFTVDAMGGGLSLGKFMIEGLDMKLMDVDFTSPDQATVLEQLSNPFTAFSLEGLAVRGIPIDQKGGIFNAALEEFSADGVDYSTLIRLAKLEQMATQPTLKDLGDLSGIFATDSSTLKGLSFEALVNGQPVVKGVIDLVSFEVDREAKLATHKIENINIQVPQGAFVLEESLVKNINLKMLDLSSGQIPFGEFWMPVEEVALKGLKIQSMGSEGGIDKIWLKLQDASLIDGVGRVPGSFDGGIEALTIPAAVFVSEPTVMQFFVLNNLNEMVFDLYAKGTHDVETGKQKVVERLVWRDAAAIEVDAELGGMGEEYLKVYTDVMKGIIDALPKDIFGDVSKILADGEAGEPEAEKSEFKFPGLGLLPTEALVEVQRKIVIDSAGLAITNDSLVDYIKNWMVGTGQMPADQFDALVIGTLEGQKPGLQSIPVAIEIVDGIIRIVTEKGTLKIAIDPEPGMAISEFEDPALMNDPNALINRLNITVSVE